MIDWDTSKDAGTHKVFIPSYKEIVKGASGYDTETLNSFIVNNKTNRIGFVLMDRTFNENSSLTLFTNDNGPIKTLPTDYKFPIRPALVLELSKVNYTVK